MSEKKYIVSDNNKVIASEMTIEDALLFVKAYFNEYYNERLSLTITQICQKQEINQMNENYHYILTKELVVEVYEQVYPTYEEAYTRLKHEYEETESNELNDYGNMKENEAYVRDYIPEIKVHDIDVEAQDLEYHWKIHKVADS